VSQGPGQFFKVMRRQGLTASLAGLRIDVLDMIHLGFREKGAFFAFVPDLASSFPAAWPFALFVYSGTV